MKRRKATDKERIIRDGTKKFSCYCPRLETRIEDFTYRKFGSEVTRTLELQVCLDCDERHIPGRPVLQMEAELTAKVLALANERLDVPKDYVYLKYFDDADLLVIHYKKLNRLQDKGKKVIKYSKADYQNGIIYNFDFDDNLVMIELLDFYSNLYLKTKS